MRAARRMQNDALRQAALAFGSLGTLRIGLVSSYDPQAHSVKVRIQPSDIESGWLPIKPLAPGPGWGMAWGPSQDDQVLVAFQEGSLDAGVCLGGIWSDVDTPLAVPSGEFWLVHKSTSSLKFTNDGRVSLVAVHGLEITGETSVTGSLDVSGNVTVGNGASGSFTTVEGLTVTVQDGIVTNIA